MITRGIKKAVDEVIRDLQAQYFPFKYKNKAHMVQLAVRPIQLWELVMPRDSLQTVMRSIWNDGKGMENERMVTPLIKSLRFPLKAKKLPKFEKGNKRILTNIENVACYPIGIKDDVDNHEGEML